MEQTRSCRYLEESQSFPRSVSSQNNSMCQSMKSFRVVLYLPYPTVILILLLRSQSCLCCLSRGDSSYALAWSLVDALLLDVILPWTEHDVRSVEYYGILIFDLWYSGYLEGFLCCILDQFPSLRPKRCISLFLINLN